MKTRRHVILFQERFAPAVARGTKPHTIRPRRKRRIRAGDTLDLRAWTGKPYRSKQRKLREVTCIAVMPIEVDRLRWLIWVKDSRTRLLDSIEALHLAQRDGFASLDEMFNWFEAMHGLPFKGELIAWEP
jgi:hypothetical protein